MAIALRGSYDNGGAANTTGSGLNFSLSGTNAVAGDVAIACIYSRANTKTVTSVSNVTPVSGQYVSTANGGMIWLGQKVLTATDITNGYFGTYDLNSVSNGTVGYSVMVFSGVDTTTPIDGTATPVAGGASNLPDPPACTHTAGSTIVTAMGKMDDSAATVTAPTNYTTAATAWWDSTSGTDGTSGLAYRLAVSGTSEDPGTWTTSSGGLSTYWYACTISLAVQAPQTLELALSSEAKSSVVVAGTKTGGAVTYELALASESKSSLTVAGATSKGILADDCTSYSAWVNNGSGTFDYDTAHVREGNSQQMRYSMSSAVYMSIYKKVSTTALNLTTGVLEAWIYMDVDTWTANQAYKQLSIRIGSDSTQGTWSNYYNTAIDMQGYIHPGWNCLRFAADTNVHWQVGAGSPSFSSIYQIWFSMTSSTGTVTKLTFGPIRYQKPPGTAYFLWTFDDGYDSSYSVVEPILTARGQKATVYADRNVVGSGGRYITLAHLQALRDAGWWVGLHGSTGFNTLTEAQIETELQAEIDWSDANGFDAQGLHGAYPLTNYTPNTFTALGNFPALRTWRTAGARHMVGEEAVASPSKWNILSRSDGDAQTLTWWQNRIDATISTGTALIMLTHDVNYSSYMTTVLLTGIADYIQTKSLAAPNIQEWFEASGGAKTLELALTSEAKSAVVVAGTVVEAGGTTQELVLTSEAKSAVVVAGSAAHVTHELALASEAVSNVTIAGAIVHATHELALSSEAKSEVAVAGQKSGAAVTHELALVSEAESNLSVSGTITHATWELALASESKSALVVKAYHTPADTISARYVYLYGTEVGCWHTDGSPEVYEGSSTYTPDSGIPAKVIDAGLTVVRFSVYDIFTSWTGGNPWPAQFSGGSGKRPDGSNGTQSLANFQKALHGLTQHFGPKMVLLFKLLPNAGGVNTGVEQRIFMPPLDNLSRDLNIHKAILYEIAQVYTGPIIIESDNEGEYTATDSSYPSTWRSTWGFTSDSNTYLSHNLGMKWNATMPAVKKYARDDLGFNEVITVGYIGLGGGAARSGSSYTADGGYDYGYHWTTTKQLHLNEFITAAKSGTYSKNSSGTNVTNYPNNYDSTGDADYIPDSVSIHDYSHGPNFVASAPYECDDNLIKSYWRQWIKDGRANMRSILGTTLGDKVLFSVSEWAAGSSNSVGVWSGWSTPATVQTFYSGWFDMLRGNGTLTGSSSTRWWVNIQFCLASNESSPGTAYDLIGHDSPWTATAWYSTLKELSLTDPLRPSMEMALSSEAKSSVTVAGTVAEAGATQEMALTSEAKSALVVTGTATHVTLELALTSEAKSAVAVAGSTTHATHELALASEAKSVVVVAGSVAHAVHELALVSEAKSAVVVVGSSVHAVWELTLASEGISAIGVTASVAESGTTHEFALVSEAKSAVVVAGAVTHAVLEMALSSEAVSVVNVTAVPVLNSITITAPAVAWTQWPGQLFDVVFDCDGPTISGSEIAIWLISADNSNWYVGQEVTIVPGQMHYSVQLDAIEGSRMGPMPLKIAVGYRQVYGSGSWRAWGGPTSPLCTMRYIDTFTQPTLGQVVGGAAAPAAWHVTSAPTDAGNFHWWYTEQDPPYDWHAGSAVPAVGGQTSYSSTIDATSFTPGTYQVILGYLPEGVPWGDWADLVYSPLFEVAAELALSSESKSCITVDGHVWEMLTSITPGDEPNAAWVHWPVELFDTNWELDVGPAYGYFFIWYTTDGGTVKRRIQSSPVPGQENATNVTFSGLSDSDVYAIYGATPHQILLGWSPDDQEGHVTVSANAGYSGVIRTISVSNPGVMDGTVTVNFSITAATPTGSGAFYISLRGDDENWCEIGTLAAVDAQTVYQAANLDISTLPSGSNYWLEVIFKSSPSDFFPLAARMVTGLTLHGYSELALESEAVSALTVSAQKAGNVTRELALVSEAKSAVAVTGGKSSLKELALASESVSAINVTAAVSHQTLEMSLTSEAKSAVAVMGTIGHATWEFALSSEAVTSVIIAGAGVHAVWPMALASEGRSSVTVAGQKNAVFARELELVSEATSRVNVTATRDIAKDIVFSVGSPTSAWTVCGPTSGWEAAAPESAWRPSIIEQGNWEVREPESGWPMKKPR